VRRCLRRGRIPAFAAVLALLASCSAGGLPTRDSVFPAGFEGMGAYHVLGSTDGSSQQNGFVLQGVDQLGPIPLSETSFGKGSGLRTETVTITDQTGRQVYALGMNRREYTVGLSKYLDLQVGYFQQLSVSGQSLCGIKLRMDFQPNAWQFLAGELGRQPWEAVALYSVPCAMGTLPDSAIASVTAPSASASGAKAKATPTPSAPAASSVPANPVVHLDIAHAQMFSLTISQQLAPRLFSKPWVVNGGNAVMLVGGQLAALKPGWWLSPISTQFASSIIGRTVQDLGRHHWQGVSNSAYGTPLWVAGDADSFLGWQKLVLNRQGNYLVNFRMSANAPWIHVGIERQYDYGWNDWTKNYKAFFGQDMPNINDLVNADGTMKDISGDDLEKLQDIRASGCENCPNPSESQIRWMIGGHTVYADTFRGFWGSDSSLLMMGNVPNITPGQADSQAEKIRKSEGSPQCPLRVDAAGNALPADKQLSDDQCAKTLEDGALTRLLVTNPAKYGFDQILNLQVNDSSTVASVCEGSGSSTYCHLQVQNTRLDASYGYTDLGQKNYRALVVNDLLGPVGATTSGLGYAAGPSTGSGALFALAQPTVRNQYYSNLMPSPQNYARLFLLDTPGEIAPGLLLDAADALGFGHQN
jgi:hypothetical protein